MAKDVNIVDAVSDDGAFIRKGIEGIRRRDASFRREVMVVAISVTMHATKHGDITLARDLLAALKMAYQAEPVKNWLIAYGPFSWGEVDMDGKSTKTLIHDASKAVQLKKELSKDRAAFVSKRNDDPYWVFDPPKELKDFDLFEMLEKVLKRGAKTAKEHPEAVGDKIKIDGLAEVRAAIARVKESLKEDSTEDSGSTGGEGSPAEAAAPASVH